MKVAHVLAGAGWGGAERIACAVAEGARARGVDVMVDASPYSRAGAESAAVQGLTRATEVETRFAATRESRPRVLLRWARAARARVAAYEPDVVHVHLSTPGFAAAGLAITAGWPTVYTFQLLPLRPDWPLDYAARLPSTWALRLAQRVQGPTFVGVSRTDTALLRERFPSRPAVLVANAPPPAGPEPTPIDRSAWAGATPRLLFVGRLEPQKGLERLLRALAAPVLASVPFRLLIIGDGSERKRLAQLTQHSGLSTRVEFLGERPSRSAMEAADVVLSPSLYEGMPLVPMEAIREGAAVLASPIAPHRELFSHIPGSLLSEDERAWPEELARVFTDPARLASLKEAQAASRAEHSTERMIGEYVALYERVARRGV